MPPSLCSLPLFDKQRNRITIWTGPGAARKPALPFSCILCSMKGAQERHKSARQGFFFPGWGILVAEERRAFCQRTRCGGWLLIEKKEDSSKNMYLKVWFIEMTLLWFIFRGFEIMEMLTATLKKLQLTCLLVSGAEMLTTAITILEMSIFILIILYY